MTPAGYIQEHLENLVLNLKTMRFDSEGGFWSLNVDTFLVSLVLGLLFIGVFALVAKRATAGIPGPMQNAIEALYEFVDNICKENFSRPAHFVAPFAMTVFIWVFLMNFMDLVPVDLLPQILGRTTGVEHWRSVSTADPYTTFALSIGVFICLVYHNLRYKGVKGLTIETLSMPFGWWCLPLNIAFHSIEAFVKVFSLSLRLFGNLFAGEMIFILIAALIPWYLGWLPGLVWCSLHMLIISIQAFIFMFLSVMYLNMAVEMEH